MSNSGLLPTKKPRTQSKNHHRKSGNADTSAGGAGTRHRHPLATCSGYAHRRRTQTRVPSQIATPRGWSSCAGTSRTRSAPQPVPCAHNRPQIVPSVFVLAGCRFTYTCVYGQPASTKGGNRYARPVGWPRVKIHIFEGRGCAECAHP